MELKELVDGFATTLGLEGLTLDNEGVAVFEADEMLVRISDQPQTRTFVLEGEIGEPPLECRDQFERSLLRLNLALLPSSSVSIALAEDEAYVLQAVCGYENLAQEAFVERIKSFLDELERIRTLLGSFAPASEELAEEAEVAAAEARSASFGGFIQV